MLTLIGVAVFGLSFVLVTYVFRIEDGDERSLMFFGLVFASWAFVELAFTLYLRRRRKLECVPNT